MKIILIDYRKENKNMKIFLFIVVGYVGIVTFICLFLKGATRLGNECDEKRELEELRKNIESKSKGKIQQREL